MVVQAELQKLGLHPVSVALGEVVIEEKHLSKKQLEEVADALGAVGFELIDDKRSKLIEQIKTAVIEHVHYQDEPNREKFSVVLSRRLNHDYSYLSNLFSETEGITIEQYIITQKIEKVKELMMYDELSLSQIAFQMGYSSAAHLSSQFKKLTGLTPTAFRKLGMHARKSLDDLANKM
jgi:AraC-like DNA-binding protein